MPSSSEITFIDESGAHVSGTVRWMRGHDDPAAARLELVVPPSAVATVFAEGLFHLIDGTYPADASIDHDRALTLHLRPGPGIETPDEGMPRDDPARWLSADPDRLRCARWFATTLTQADDGAAPTSIPTLWGAMPAWPDTESDHDGAPDAAESLNAALDFLRSSGSPAAAQLPAVTQLLAEFGALPDGGDDASPTADALAALFDVLTADGADVEVLEDGTGLGVAITGQSGAWPCLVQSVPGQALIFYGIIPDPVPSDALQAAYEAVARCNTNQLVGAVDIDPDSGRMVARVPLLLSGTPPTSGLLRGAMDQLVDLMDEVAPVLTPLTT